MPQAVSTPFSGLRRRRYLEIVDEFVDTGVSGAKSSRPARDRLLEAAGLRQVGLVLCWRLDRRGRSVNDTVDTLRLLAGYGVHFLAVSQGLGTEDSNPMPWCMMTLMAALAEMEREMIVGRVIEGVRKAQAAGKHSGRPRRVVRRDVAVEMRATGKSWAQIGIALGVPAGTVREGWRKPSIEPAVEMTATAGS